MSGTRIGLCVTLLIAGASGVEAGGRKHRGCGVPAYSCAAPLTCAAPAGCAMPGCAAPLSCVRPLSCAAPACAASYGGYGFGDGFPDGHFADYPFGGPVFVMRYPTRGMTPAVIPGDEIVW